jgi:hypothetical protein
MEIYREKWNYAMECLSSNSSTSINNPGKKRIRINNKELFNKLKESMMS